MRAMVATTTHSLERVIKVPNIQTYNFSLPNGELKASGPFRNAHTAAYYLLDNLPEEIGQVLDVHNNRYERSDKLGYVKKNNHELKVISELE